MWEFNVQFRNLDENNDFTWGKGKQNYAQTEQAINVNIKALLQTYLTECFFDRTVGVPWFNACGSKDKTLILLETKKVIANAYGVTEVMEVEFNISEDRQATIIYEVKTIYTKQGQAVTGEVTI